MARAMMIQQHLTTVSSHICLQGTNNLISKTDGHANNCDIRSELIHALNDCG